MDDIGSYILLPLLAIILMPVFIVLLVIGRMIYKSFTSKPPAKHVETPDD